MILFSYYSQNFKFIPPYLMKTWSYTACVDFGKPVFFSTNCGLLIDFSRQPPFLPVISFNLASKEVRRSEHEVMGLWFASYYKKKCKFMLSTLFTSDLHSLLTSLYLRAGILKYHHSRNPSFSIIPSTIISKVFHVVPLFRCFTDFLPL
jgi:hypothetical protein